MPTYEYRCAGGHITDAVRSVDTRHDAPACEACGAATEKIISAIGHAMPDIGGYRSVIDGRWIGSRSAHREHLRAHGVVEVGNERLPERKPIKMPRARESILRAMETTR